MRNYGWEPIVYTVDQKHDKNGDQSVMKDVPEGIEVLKCPIIEPFQIFQNIMAFGKSKKVQPGFVNAKKGGGKFRKLMFWIRGNFFIPDARKFWINPSVRYLNKYLKENPVDLLVSTGPPHTTHVIAQRVKRATGVKWLADFRDPWTNIDFYKELQLSEWADEKHHRMEKEVLTQADKVTTVSWNWGKELEEIGGKPVTVITNGFDDDDFESGGEVTTDFLILHAGSMNKDRNPYILWRALGRMCKDNAKFAAKLKIELIGAVDYMVIKEINENGLKDYVTLIDRLNHDEVIAKQCSCAVLLLALNDTPNISGVVPGKLFEYLRANRPILTIGDKSGDSAKIITKTNHGVTVGFTDEAEVESTNMWWGSWRILLRVLKPIAEKLLLRRCVGSLMK